MKTRIPLRTRLRLSLFSILLLAGMFITIVIATGAYKNRQTMIMATIGIVAALAIGGGLRRLQGLLEPAIMPMSVARRDARDKPVSAQDIRLDELSLNDVEAFVLVRHMQANTPWISRRWVIVLMTAASVGGWLAWLRIGPPLVGRNATLWGGLALLLLIGFLISRLRRRASLANISDGLLATGRCAACGYDLKYLPTDADGCTVCAECGAAWRIGVWKRREPADHDDDDDDDGMGG